MMTDTPPDWVLIEAAKRCEWDARHDRLHILRTYYVNSHPFTALCDMILKHEQPPVDRKLLCAREAYRQWYGTQGMVEGLGRRAIELWEEGFGK
jgi:hypothetical protein